MTVALSPTFHDFGRVAEKHVARALPRLTRGAILGHVRDGLGSYLLRRLNTSLERDVVRMRGLTVSLESEPKNQVLDPEKKCVGWLETLETKVLAVQADALKTKADGSPKTHYEIRRAASICGQLHRALMDLRLALVEHDKKAATASAGVLVYELTARQAEQFEECRTSERQPTAEMREAGERYDALVTSR